MTPGVRSCPLCQCERSSKSVLPSTRFNGRRFDYVQCESCALTFVCPPPSANDLELMYGAGYHDAHYFQATETRSALFAFLEWHAPSKRLLDFGCGDGRFVDFALSRGWQAHGIEFDPALVARLRVRQPKASFSTVEEWESADYAPFGVLHLGDVFEHLAEPLEVVRGLTRGLRERGLLFVEGPLEANAHLTRFVMEGYLRLRRGREATHPPNHLLFTNRVNQRAALESLGVRTLRFEVEEVPWPMPSDRACLGSLKDVLKYALGQLSVAASTAMPGWGNRFVYVGALRGPSETDPHGELKT